MVYKLSEIEPTMNILIYSPPGAGKTMLAATCADNKGMSDVLFVNVEGGLLSVVHREDLLAEDIGKSSDGSPNGRIAKDLEELFWNIVKKNKGYETIKTVVIDSGTELQNMDLMDIVNENMKKKTNRSKDEITQRDYGVDTARLRRLFRLFRDAPFNVIITALAKKVYKEGVSEPIEVLPQFTEKLGESIMGYQDFVWCLFVDKEGNRKLLTQPKGPFRAKTRGAVFSKKLGNIVDNPNLSEIYRLFCSSIKTGG